MNKRKFVGFIRNIAYSMGIVLTPPMRYIGRDRHMIRTYWDYIRMSSLELVAHEIYENNVIGEVAELGVYRGHFASIINALFPDRKLYLFDTFRGFCQSDVDIDRGANFSKGDQDFSKVSVEMILRRMQYKDNVIIIEGRFPDSLVQIEDLGDLSFAFVSIDVDLYLPTLCGLEFFYQRLSKGGFIFIHDYNNEMYKGVKQAVREFCYKNQSPFFPLSDECGSAVIVK
jgi:O-methyltransferase